MCSLKGAKLNFVISTLNFKGGNFLNYNGADHN